MILFQRGMILFQRGGKANVALKIPCSFHVGDGKINPTRRRFIYPLFKDSLLKMGWVNPQYNLKFDWTFAFHSISGNVAHPVIQLSSMAAAYDSETSPKILGLVTDNVPSDSDKAMRCLIVSEHSGSNLRTIQDTTRTYLWAFRNGTP